jgi:hypothetical protein
MSFGGSPYGTRVFGAGAATGSDVTGAISWVEANDSFSVDGALTNAGSIAWTEANDTVSAQGSVTPYVPAVVDTHDGGEEPRKRRQEEWRKEREARDARKKQLSKLFGASAEDEQPEVAERIETINLPPAAFAPKPTANDLRRIAKALRREQVEQERQLVATPIKTKAVAKESVAAKDFAADRDFDEIEQDDEEILLLL